MFTTVHQADGARRLAAIALAIIMLASCAGSDASSTEATSTAETTSAAETTSTAETVDGVETVDAASTAVRYTINSGDTLSGIADRAGISLTELVNSNEWPDGSDHLILPGDVIMLPRGAMVTIRDSATPAISAAPTPTPSVTEPSGGYEPSQGPNPVSLAANQRTDPIVTPLPDGQYWSWDYTSNGESVSFTLAQYFYGDACREQFGEADNACASDNNTLYEPSATVQLAETAATTVLTCCNNAGQSVSYRVSRPEFARLVAGSAPSADAPSDFAYERNAVLVTVQNGQAVAADQIFTS